MQRPSIAPSRPLLFSLLVFVVVATFAVAASADANTEKAARDLQTKAIQEDNLATDYAGAATKLQQAITMCGTDKCALRLRAELYRDLGAMQVLNNDKDSGTASFVQALTLVSTLDLDVNYKTPALDALWAAARKKASSAPTPTPTATATAKATTPGNTDTGDFTHTAPTEQAVRTPIPIYVEYPGTEALTKVVLRYKGEGMTEFKSVELQKLGTGWGGLIPCTDVVIGTTQYFVQGQNASGDVAATMGNSTHPFKVAIKNKLDDEAPHLPGVSAPAQCQEASDCPPDFPGCKKSVPETDKKAEGDECEDDAECKSNDCKHHICAAGDDGSPSTPGSAFPRVWIGVLGSIDLISLGSADDVCLLDPKTATPLNTAGYYCTNPDGTDYPNRTSATENSVLKKGSSDQVKGGFAPGTIRLMASIDYALTQNILAGARIGYVLGTFPGAAAGNDGKGFPPVHLELRGTYLFGANALTSPGITPLVFVGAGVSEFAANVTVTVIQNGVAGTRSVQAWELGGPGFVSVGGGARYALSPKAALYGAAKLTAAFGGAGLLPSVAPELGVQLGF